MASTRGMRARRIGWLVVALIVVGGGVLRWAVWRAVDPVHPIGDEVYYLRTATQLHLGLGHGEAGRLHSDI